MPEWVDLAPLQEAALRRIAAGWLWSDIAEAYSGDRRDTSLIRRRLGLEAESYERGRKTRCTYEVAVKLARALDVDPVDVGV